MKFNKLLSLLFDTGYFLITGACCLFVFFYVSDNLAKDTSSPLLFGFLAAMSVLVLLYLIYSFIDKAITKEE